VTKTGQDDNDNELIAGFNNNTNFLEAGNGKVQVWEKGFIFVVGMSTKI
jgi:hypothetical protein